MASFLTAWVLPGNQAWMIPILDQICQIYPFDLLFGTRYSGTRLLSAHMTFFAFAPDGRIRSSSLEREREQLEDQLEDSLEDLSEGLDVLMILERAYDKTMKVHTSAAHASSGQSSSSGANKSDVGSMSERDKHRFVRKEGEGKGMRCEDTRSPVDPRSRSSPGAASSSSALSSPGPSKSSFSPSSPLSSSTSASGSSVPSSSKSNVKQHPQQSHSRTRNPMLQGSATALLAVLDHPSSPPASGVTQCASAPRSYFASSSSSSSLFAPKPRYPTPIPPLLNSNWYWAGKQDTKRDCPVVSQQPEVKDHGAVVRIAHLGDCMGMLIRGEEVVWRTEEMWWNVSLSCSLYHSNFMISGTWMCTDVNVGNSLIPQSN